MLGERTHSGLNDLMKAENPDICATGYGNRGEKTPDGTVAHNGLCSGSTGSKEGREEGWGGAPFGYSNLSPFSGQPRS